MIMGTQRSKAQLDTLFEDNNTHQITPSRLRDFVESMACSDGAIYVTTPAPTTINVAGTFVKLAGTTTLVAGAHRSDMPVDNRLRYTGLVPVHAHIVANLSVRAGSNNQTIAFAIAKNGVLLDHSIMEHFLTTGADIKVMAIHANVDLATNDYLEIWATNETSTATVTAQRAYLFFMGMLCD